MTMADDLDGVGRDLQILALLRRQVDIVEQMLSNSSHDADTMELVIRSEQIADSLTINMTQQSSRDIHVSRAEVTVEGDYFSNIGAGATVVNKSALANSLNSIGKQAGGDAADALARLARIVEESGNQDAIDNFNALSEEIVRSQPKRNLLKAFWNAINAALPGIEKLAEIGVALSKVF
jgi:hypothetical protein